MDWTPIVISVLSGALVSAVFTGIVTWINARHKNRREDRGDEIDVLQTSISQLREDSRLKDERDVRRDEEYRTLKDEHTACLVEQERARQAEKYLREDNRNLTARVKALEAKVDELQRGGHGQDIAG